MLLVLLFIGLLMLTFDIRTVKATWTGGTIYIRFDGRIDPPDAPITTHDKVTYKLTDYIQSSSHGIVIERDNIILDGDGFGVQGNETYESKGIVISGRTNITIKNLYISKFYYGVYFYKSSNNTIIESWIIGNRWYGIYLEDSNNNSVFRNNIMSNNYGVYLSLSSSYNNISGNIIESNFYGVLLQPNSNYNTIYGNDLTKNMCGIDVRSSHNFISENKIVANTYDGIHLSDFAKYNSILSNLIIRNNYGIYAYGSSHNVISSNNITDSAYFGIYFYSAKNNSIIENVIVNDHFGIYGSMDYGQISDNFISSNRWGVTLWGRFNRISGNVLVNNSIGVYLQSSNNTVFGNYMEANLGGMRLESANFNEVFENKFVANNDYGVALYQSSNNTFYHNNFIENSKQVISNFSINIWDNGYPSGGNYWSDYTGVDVYSGPFQNETGSDSIGDTPYIVDENNIDRYPLMKPYTPPPETFMLIISATIGGTTDPPPGSYIYPQGILVNVTAVPSPNYRFERWLLDGVDVGSQNPISILMDSNHTLQAVFTQITYQLSITATAGGTTDPPPRTYTYTNGTMVSVTAIPEANYIFDHWELDGVSVGSANPINILMDSNHTLHAVFVQVYTLMITSTIGGTTDLAPGIYTYVNGTRVVITAVPFNGFSFDYWLLDGVKVTQNPITIIMNANHTLEAYFVDSIPPEISEPWQDPHANNVQPLQNVTVRVNVTDYGTGIKNVTLWYSINNGAEWTILNMTALPTPSDTWITYEATINGYENCTWVIYKIIAYDNAGNRATKDNSGYGYQYHVIPEFPFTQILILLMLTTLITTLWKTKRNTNLPKLSLNHR